MKNKKTAKEKIITEIIFLLALLLPMAFSAASTNPNYGTTTFFSNKKEKPVLEKPILGAKDGAEDNTRDDEEDEDDNNDNKTVKPGDIFNRIENTVGAVVDNSVSTFNEVKRSLFDFQSDFGGSGSGEDGSFSQKEEFLIAGPRGESPDYLASIENENANVVEFNFEDVNLKTAPKKSKLLFTNKEIATDMTSQYVVITLIFLMTIGLSVGYYYWKKEAANNKEEDYD